MSRTWISDDDEYVLSVGTLVGTVGPLTAGRAWYSIDETTWSREDGPGLRNIADGESASMAEARTFVAAALEYADAVQL